MKNTIFTKDFNLICLAGFFAFFLQQMLNSTLSLYVNSFDYGADFAGILAMCFSLAATVMRLAGGHICDSKGRRNTMLAGAMIFMVSTFGFGMISNPAAMVLFRMLQGAGFAMVHTASGAAVTDVTPKERLNEGIGYFGLGQALAMAAGPGVGLSFTTNGNYRMLYVCGSIIVLFCAVFTIFVTYEKKEKQIEKTVKKAKQMQALQKKETFLSTIIEKTALGAAGLQFLYSFGLASITSFYTLYAVSKGVKNAALFYTLEAAAMFVSRIFIGKLADEKGPRPVLVSGLSLGAISFVILTITQTHGVIVGVGILIGICAGCTQPVMNALAMNRCAVNRRGAASATYFLATDLSIGLGSWFWGIVIDKSGFTWMYVGSMFVFLISIAVSIYITGEKSKSI